MFKEYNANPIASRVGDCAVRAIATATGQRWETVYDSLCEIGRQLFDMPSSNHVWGEYLFSIGYTRHIIPQLMTVREFANKHSNGSYILCISGHVVACVDGIYYDTWDSGDEIPIYFWKET